MRSPPPPRPRVLIQHAAAPLHMPARAFRDVERRGRRRGAPFRIARRRFRTCPLPTRRARKRGLGGVTDRPRREDARRERATRPRREEKDAEGAARGAAATRGRHRGGRSGAMKNAARRASTGTETHARVRVCAARRAGVREKLSTASIAGRDRHVSERYRRTVSRVKDAVDLSRQCGGAKRRLLSTTEGLVPARVDRTSPRAPTRRSNRSPDDRTGADARILSGALA